LCRRLRAKPGFVELPIALFTQSMPQEHLSRAQMGGPCHVLTKDLLVQPQVFLSRLQEILKPQASAGMDPTLMKPGLVGGTSTVASG
jgi:hypothetical protein